ncbi:hypothetical protein [Agrobacterium tumefaciens]|uniref:Uncharacterized protein n=1 Tax=Agrobacterium tumefaciens TaxID=358 RepID=A0AAW8LVI1_AGRTU|nr:hypothetical protein [Agrobacterium tumefaciens]MDR6703006.1 hypothetical protein [Agrobacterium tumefaciens]
MNAIRTFNADGSKFEIVRSDGENMVSYQAFCDGKPIGKPSLVDRAIHHDGTAAGVNLDDVIADAYENAINGMRLEIKKINQ